MSSYVKSEDESIDGYDDEAVSSFAEQYASFISSHKTEREVIQGAKDIVDGATTLGEAHELRQGNTYLLTSKEKNLAIIRYNGFDDIHAVASHVDSPCLHLKPFPVQEEDNVSLLKSHYYGGVKEYQWLNLPLSLRGVAYTSAGERVNVRLGDDKDDPVLTIPDLLPHLSHEYEKKQVSEAVKGEHLNALAGNEHLDDAEDETLRKNTLQLLNDEYGLTERDLVGAELRLVPTGTARDLGFDRRLLTGYGHDDRSSVYTSLRAFQDTTEGEATQICMLYDKEEIGSEGTTGAKNAFWNTVYETLLDKADTEHSVNEVWRNTTVISADVTGASNPNFNDVQDPSNSTYLGRGFAVKKYTGSGGKFRAQDASAELTSSLIHMADREGIPWQSGTLGKIDIGGGGTIAKFIANRGAEVIDAGVPVLGMHAPQEVLSKADLYSFYKCCEAFYSSTYDRV